VAICARAQTDGAWSYFLKNFKIFTGQNYDGRKYIEGASFGFRPSESHFGVNLQIQQDNCLEAASENLFRCLQLFGTELLYYPSNGITIGVGYESRNRSKEFIEDNRLQLRFRLDF
jgi:hypothetical protein